MVLVIISHTEHYYSSNGCIVGWEPTIREINQLCDIFDIVYHVAPLHSGLPHDIHASYKSDKSDLTIIQFSLCFI